jgi:hypothetical protein
VARRWWHRRRRQRQLGYALYGFAVALLLVGLLAVAGGRVGRNQVRAGTDAASRVPVNTLTPAIAGTTVPAPVDPDPNNNAPVITAPANFTVLAAGVSQIQALSVDDLEAHASGDVIGVILYAPMGRIHLRRVTGLQVFQANPGVWIPIIGRLDAINAALAQVGYEPTSPASRATLQIAVSDFGGRARRDIRTATKTVEVRVTR